MPTRGLIFTVSVPKTTQWDATRSQQFMEQFLHTFGGGIFHIHAEASGIIWRIHKDVDDQEIVEQAIHSLYPQASLEVAEYQRLPPVPSPFYRYVLKYRLANSLYSSPILTTEDINPQNDPLSVITQTMGMLRTGERIVYTVIAHQISRDGYKLGMDVIYEPIPGSGLFFPSKRPRFASHVQRVLEGKLNRPLYETYFFIQLDTPNRERINTLLLIDGQVSLFDKPEFNGLRWQEENVSKEIAYVDTPEKNRETSAPYYYRLWTVKEQRLSGELSRMGRKALLRLEPGEIAALWHFPHTGFSSTNVAWSSPIPAQVVSDGQFHPDRVRIGSADGNTTKIALSRPDTRYHRYITGQTGMGKSTLLHHLITEDIHAGCGVAVLDPHGTLIRDILECSIPPERVGDVVLLELGDGRRPVPLNPFRTPTGVDEQQRFDTVFWIFKSLYAGSWSETRMETTIRNILQVLSADPEATPLDFQEIILNDTYRRKIVERAVQQSNLSRASRNWWNMFNELPPSDQRSQTQSVLSRLNAFLGSAQVEKMTCHPKLLDFRQFITQKKIVLVNMKGDAINSEVGSLGAILLSQFYLASLALGDIPGDAPPRYYMYVDEAQRFITTALPAMFSEARKFGLALTLSNQYLGQLDDETREGILKNVGTKVSFECHPDEARLTGKMYEPDIDAATLTSLGRGRAVVKTRSSGETLQAFVVKVTPPLHPSGQPSLPRLLPFPTAQEVDDWLTKRYEGDLFKKPPAETKLKDFEPPVPHPPPETPAAPSTSLDDFEPPQPPEEKSSDNGE